MGDMSVFQVNTHR